MPELISPVIGRSLIADLSSRRWVTLALKCPLVKAILSAKSRKDQGLKAPPPLTHLPFLARLALWSFANPPQSSQQILDTQQPTWSWLDKLLWHCTCGARHVVSIPCMLLPLILALSYVVLYNLNELSGALPVTAEQLIVYISRKPIKRKCRVGLSLSPVFRYHTTSIMLMYNVFIFHLLIRSIFPILNCYNIIVTAVIHRCYICF